MRPTTVGRTSIIEDMPMRAWIRPAGLLLVLSLCGGIATAAEPLPPDQQLQPLFQQVQGAHLFVDNCFTAV